MMFADMESGARVTIFEAINLSRKELFIAATALPMHALIASISASAPPEVGGWRTDDAVEYRSLAFNMKPADAPAFIRLYSATQAEWRIITTARIIGS